MNEWMNEAQSHVIRLIYYWLIWPFYDSGSSTALESFIFTLFLLQDSRRFVGVTAGVWAGLSVQSVLVRTETAKLRRMRRSRDVLRTRSRAVLSPAPTVHHPSSAVERPRAPTTVSSSCRTNVLRCRQSTARRIFLRAAGQCWVGSQVQPLIAPIHRHRCRPIPVQQPSRPARPPVVDRAKLGICAPHRGQWLYETNSSDRLRLRSSLCRATPHPTMHPSWHAVTSAVEN